jgi:hypothetical protein
MTAPPGVGNQFLSEAERGHGLDLAPVDVLPVQGLHLPGRHLFAVVDGEQFRHEHASAIRRGVLRRRSQGGRDPEQVATSWR